MHGAAKGTATRIVTDILHNSSLSRPMFTQRTLNT